MDNELIRECNFSRYTNASRIPDSVIAKEYARANGIVISWVNGAIRTYYGFRELETRQEIIPAWPRGFSSYRALYNGMKRYAATGKV